MNEPPARRVILLLLVTTLFAVAGGLLMKVYDVVNPAPTGEAGFVEWVEARATIGAPFFYGTMALEAGVWAVALHRGVVRGWAALGLVAVVVSNASVFLPSSVFPSNAVFHVIWDYFWGLVFIATRFGPLRALGENLGRPPAAGLVAGLVVAALVVMVLPSLGMIRRAILNEFEPSLTLEALRPVSLALYYVYRLAYVGLLVWMLGKPKPA